MTEMLSGKDRVEFCNDLGRPIRQGDLFQLKSSDFDTVIKALEKKDSNDVKSRIGLMNALYTAITSTFLEWAIALPATLSGQGHSNIERGVTRESYRIWLEGVLGHKEFRYNSSNSTNKAMHFLQEKLNPNQLSPSSIVDFRKSQPSNEASKMLEETAQEYIKTIKLIEQNNFEESILAFEKYFDNMRACHDLVCEFVLTYIGIIESRLNQHVAADVMQRALESCPLVSGMWDSFGKLRPDLWR